jgi:tetrahydromethanopterin S-methyltransferase subunit C
MEKVSQKSFFRHLGITSIALGLVGAAFCWWTPLGMVVALTGLIMGLVGWIDAGRRSQAYHLAVAGLTISTAAFLVGLVIALRGWEIIQLHSYR